MNNRKRNSGVRRIVKWLSMSIFLVIAVSLWEGTGSGLAGTIRAQAATITCKSNYFVTTKINKKSLKKGKKAKVTITVKNTTGAAMKNLKISVALPGCLKKTSGSLSKTKASLAAGKTCSFSFKVKAKKKVTFKKTVKSSKTMIGLTTKTVSKNLVKRGSAKKWIKVTTTNTRPASALINPDSYADSMIDLLANMNTYAKSKNPAFAMITNGGYGLYMTEYNKNDTSRKQLLSSMDGILIEEVFTGGTASSTSNNMQKAFKQGKQAGLAAFNLEYKGTDSVIATKSDAAGSVWYNAPSYDLNTIPSLAASRTNSNSITKLSQVKNFLALLDYEKYSTKAKYFAAIKDTNYDLIFIDAFYDDKLLTKAEVESLKVKKNGGKRLVCAYVSVGEAEKYRYYWDKDWNSNLPVWIDSENKDWPGNYKVKYWSPDWQEILCNSSSSYLAKVVGAGFDGAYLDVIDAYEFFEKKY